MKNNNTILIVDKQIVFSDTLKDTLKTLGYEVKQAFTAQTALTIIHDEKIKTIFLDPFLPDMDGFKFVRKAYKLKSNLNIIFMSSYSKKYLIKNSLKKDIYFLSKPFQMEDVSIILSKINKGSKRIIRTNKVEIPFILNSKTKQLQHSLNSIKEFVKKSSTILLIGEYGSGLNEMASYAYSNYKNSVFVKCDCSCLPEPILTYHIFGYEKDAFKGALKRKYGLLEIANKGTLFLENFNYISRQTQQYILDAIKTKTFKRIGGFENIKLNIKFIVSIENESKKKEIIPELYSIFSKYTIHIPPLRKRKKDILNLIYSILKKYNIDYKYFQIDKSALSLFEKYPWPKNVYELENIVYNSILLSNSKGIFVDNLPTEIIISENIIKKDFSLEDIEKRHIYNILSKTNNNKAKAARILGVNRKTLYRKIIKYELEEFYD